jgi:hypothetical protein
MFMSVEVDVLIWNWTYNIGSPSFDVKNSEDVLHYGKRLGFKAKIAFKKTFKTFFKK